MALALHFVVLEALGEEQDAFEGEDVFARIPQIITTNLDFILEFGSIFCVEGRLSVEKLEQYDADGPDVGLVRIV